jgi:hypothetical protein
MEILDKARIDPTGISCEAAVEVPLPRWAIQRIIDICDGRLAPPPSWSPPRCPSELDRVLGDELIACGPGLVKGCPTFGEKIGPICPFDPIDKFDKMKLQLRLEELETKVQDLGSKLGQK